MEILNNKFRQLCLLKHRAGKDNVTIPLLFKGEINYFKELPTPVQVDELDKVYSNFRQKPVNKFTTTI